MNGGAPPATGGCAADATIGGITREGAVGITGPGRAIDATGIAEREAAAETADAAEMAEAAAEESSIWRIPPARATSKGWDCGFSSGTGGTTTQAKSGATVWVG